MDTSTTISTYVISIHIHTSTICPKSNVGHATIPIWDATVPRLGAPQTSVFNMLTPLVQDRLRAPQSGPRAQAHQDCRTTRPQRLTNPTGGIESRLEGVNRAKLKFTKLITTTSRVSVRNIIKSARESEKQTQANEKCDTRICFTEVRFSQTYSPLRWSQRPGIFQPFPSLKRSLGPSELSLLNHLEHKVPTRTTTRLVSLVSITSEFDRNKESRKKKAIQAQELERTQANLSH
jgi:hypothetical protein